MDFDEFVGPEDLGKEYKEFTFNLAGLPLDIDTCESYCMSNQFDFNDIVINNLNKYCEVYLPKYLSSFLNLDNTNISKFIIGINDFGYVKGIPFKGELPTTELLYMMYKIIYKNIKCDGFINYCKYIKINFNKVNFNKSSSSVNPKFVNYLIEKNKHNDKYKKFLLEYDKWKEKFLYINKKLVDLVNSPDSRKQLINYIKSLDPTNPVIDLLLTDYKLETKTHAELIEYKKYNNNPYYWVTKWKDEYREYILSLKTIFNIDFPYKNIPYNLIQSISDMIPYWMNNNDNMNLYIISFDIICPIKNHKFKYFDTMTGKWLYCERKIINNQPVCNINK